VPDEISQPLSPSEVAELDSAYVPFPPFSEWPSKARELDLWDQRCEVFKTAAGEATDSEVQKARQIALRAAAFDTGAIEGLYATNRGLTFSVAEQAAAWEQQIESQGPDARILFEAQLRALELVLDHVTTQMPKITQAWIRRIHEEITAAQEIYLVYTAAGPQTHPLPRGKYKEHPNHVRTASGEAHAYAPVDQTQSEMQRFLQELETPGFTAAHPVIQTAYVHYALVAVHPFADGNGRVARAAASAFTYRAASVPLLILQEHRDEYFDSLAKADLGESQDFVDFIAQVSRETLELMHDSLQTAQAPQPESVLEKFDEMNRVDRRSKERDEIAQDLIKWLRGIVDEQVEELKGSSSVDLAVTGVATNKVVAPAGFRRIQGPSGARAIRISAVAIAPKKAEMSRRIDIFVSDDPKARGQLCFNSKQSPRESVIVNLSDLWPKPSGLAQHRVENFVRRVLGRGLEALHSQVIDSSRA
jgi:Fic family protein